MESTCTLGRALLPPSDYGLDVGHRGSLFRGVRGRACRGHSGRVGPAQSPWPAMVPPSGYAKSGRWNSPLCRVRYAKEDVAARRALAKLRYE